MLIRKWADHTVLRCGGTVVASFILGALSSTARGFDYLVNNCITQGGFGIQQLMSRLGHTTGSVTHPLTRSQRY